MGSPVWWAPMVAVNPTLVEALRWVMGENSAKRMRGSEMDDVIFAGSANRARPGTWPM